MRKAVVRLLLQVLAAATHPAQTTIPAWQQGISEVNA